MDAIPVERHQQSMIAVNDPDFSVRLGAMTDLERISAEAREDLSTATWSSGAAPDSQVAADTNAVVLPTIRNGGRVMLHSSARRYACFLTATDWALCSKKATSEHRRH